MAKDPTIKVSLDYESKSSAKSKLNSRITEIEQVAKTLKVGLDFKSVSAKELNASLSKLSGSISKITLDKFNKDLENSLNYAERLAKSINEISKTNIGKSIKGDSAKSIEKEIKEQKAIQDKARQDELNAQKKHEEEKAKAENDAQKKRISDTKKFREEMKAEEEAIAKEMAKIKQENEKNDKSFSEYLDKVTDPSKAGNGIKGMVRQGVSSVNQESKDALGHIKRQVKEVEALAKAMDEAKQKQEALNSTPQPRTIGQDGLDDKVSKYTREIEKLSLSGNISKKAIEDLQNRLNSFTSDTPVNEIRDFERAFGELKGYDGNINTLSNKLSKVQQELKKISSTAIDLKDETAIKEANKLELELEQVNEELRKMSSGEITSNNKVNKDITGIQKNVENLGRSLKAVDTRARESNNAFKEFGRVLGVYSLAYTTVNMVKRAFRDGVDAIKSYDKAMTTLSITMNGFTETRLDNFGKKLVQLSNDLSTTSSKVMEIATTFANASETMESILGKTQSATIMSNISGLSGQDSVSVIEGAMQQFDALKDKSEKSAMKVADSMTAISKSMGIDFGVGIKGMQEGVEKFGAVANQLGMDVDQTLAMIGTIQEKMRIDGSEAGTALRSVAARTMRIKGVDGVEDSDFSNAEKALKSFNVEIRKANGQMNDFWDIMKQVYDMKSKGLINDQEWFNLSEAMGGVRQMSIVMTAVQNMNRVSELADIGAKSQGAAMEAQEKWADSLEGKLQNLMGVAQEFWIKFIDSDAVKGGIDFLTGMLELLTRLQETFGSLGLSAGLLAGAFVSFTNNGIKDAMGNIAKEFFNSDKSLKELIKTEGSYIAIKRTEKTVTDASNVSTKAGAVSMNIFGVAVDLAKIKVIALQAAMTMGLSFAITMIIGGIAKLAGHLSDTSAKTGMLSKEMQEFNEKSRDHRETLDKTIDSAKSIQGEMNRLNQAYANTSSVEEREAITKKLLEQQQKMAEVLPNTVTDINEHGKAVATNNEIIQAAIALKEKELQLEAQSWFEKNKNLDVMKEQAKANIELLKSMELAKAKGDNTIPSNTNTDQANAEANKVMGVSSRKQTFNADDMKQAREQIEQTIQTTQEALANYDNLTSAQQKALGITRTELEETLLSLSKMVTEADNFTGALDNSANTAKDVKAEIKGITDEMDGANDKAELLAKAMKEFKDTQTLSYDTQKKMLESGDDRIIALLGQKNDFMTIANQLYDEQISKRDTSMQQMIVLMQMESEKQRLEAEGFSESARLLDSFINVSNGAYSTDLQNFRAYQNGKAKADEVTIKALAHWLQSLVGGNIEAYEKDLRNTKSWAETKSLILQELDKNMQKIQNQLSETYDKINKFAQEDNGFGMDSLQMEKEAQRLENQLDKIKDSASDIKTDFSNIGTDFIGLSDPLTTLNNKGNSGSKKKDPEYTAKLEQWYNLKDSINDVNKALEENRRLQKGTDDAEKIKLMEKEISLMKQQVALNKQLQAEMEKEKKAIQDKIKAKGGIFQGDNLINGDSLLGYAKGEKSVEEMKALEQLIKDYTTLTNQTIPSVIGEWQDLENAIKDVRKEQADLAISLEKDVYEAVEHYLKKEFDARKKALDDKKKLLEDSWKQEDREDKLADAEAQLEEIDAQIQNAIRSGDKELEKQLRKQYAEQQKALNEMIRDQEREDISDKFDQAQDDYDKQLEEMLKPENINKLIQNAMQTGIVEIMGQTIDLSKLMTDFLSETTIGAIETSQALKEMADNLSLMGELMKELPDIKGDLGLPEVSYGSRSRTINDSSIGNKTMILNTPLVSIDKIDAESIGKFEEIMNDKMEWLMGQINFSYQN